VVGAELELTAFINPMVVLVTFLLINVVFSHSAVLDLNLPGPSNGISSDPAEKLELEVTVRQNAVEVGDRRQGRIAAIADLSGGPDVAQLTTQLEQLKASHPQQKDATVLLDPEVSYDRLVQVMDAVRQVDRQVDGQHLISELFPQISIGDAVAAEH
jgi:biopolymer transport protein ExbD